MGKPKLKAYESKSKADRGYKWRVFFDSGEKRLSRKFRTKKEANTFLNEKDVDLINLERETAIKLNDGLKKQAVKAQKILGSGISIIEAARIVAEQRKRARRSAMVSELVEAFLAHQTQEGASAPHLNDLKCRLGRFCKDFGDRIASEVEQPEVDHWLNTLTATRSARERADGSRVVQELGRPISAQSRKNYATVLRGFFGWCMEAGTVDRIPVRKTRNGKRKGKVIHIFTPAQMATVLKAVAEWNPEQTKPKGKKREGDYVRKAPAKGDIVANIVLGAFAGLRDSEIRRLDWAQIRLDRESPHIDLSALQTKTAARRLPKVRAPLGEWLLQFCPKRTGKLILPNFPNRIAAFRRYLKENHGIDWKEFPNALRHSFGSYLYAETQDAAQVAEQMGHSNTATLFEHYREVVEKKEAAEFWALSPEKVLNEEKVIQLKEVANG